MRFAKVLCVDRGTAQDVVQEVLLRAHARWAGIGVLDAPEAYLRKMIVNEYLSWRRKWARIVPVADIPERHAGVDVAAAVAGRAALVSEIAALPPRPRAALVLRFFGDLSDAQIAADMGCSVGTVRSHLSRALTSLRVQILDSRCEEESGERLGY